QLALFVLHHPAPTHIYTLSLHDALPISRATEACNTRNFSSCCAKVCSMAARSASKSRAITSNNFCCCARTAAVSLLPVPVLPTRSEEHTSELQSRENLVCRLLLEKKKDG